MQSTVTYRLVYRIEICVAGVYDPVLGGAKSPRILVSPARAAEQFAVNLQHYLLRKLLPDEQLLPLHQGKLIVDYLPDILLELRGSWFLAGFVAQYVLHGRHRPFDA